MNGIILVMDWYLIVRGLTLWQHLTVARERWGPDSSWHRIVLVPSTEWGFVTRIGLLLAGLVLDWQIGPGFALSWKIGAASAFYVLLRWP